MRLKIQFFKRFLIILIFLILTSCSANKLKKDFKNSNFKDNINEIVRIFYKEKSLRYYNHYNYSFFIRVKMYDFGFQLKEINSDSQFVKIYKYPIIKKNDEYRILKYYHNIIYDYDTFIDKERYFDDFFFLYYLSIDFKIHGITSFKLYKREELDYVVIALSNNQYLMYNEHINKKDPDYKVIEEFDKNWYRVSINYKMYFTHNRNNFTLTFPIINK